VSRDFGDPSSSCVAGARTTDTCWRELRLELAMGMREDGLNEWTALEDGRVGAGRCVWLVEMRIWQNCVENVYKNPESMFDRLSTIRMAMLAVSPRYSS
jgi:hypothetical protein